MIKIQVHRGLESIDYILFDDVKQEFSIPIKDQYGNFEIVSVKDLDILKVATEDNVKSIDTSWNLLEAESEINRGSIIGAAFGILGIVGEMAVKGYDLTFIAKFKNGRKLLATIKSKAFEKINFHK